MPIHIGDVMNRMTPKDHFINNVVFLHCDYYFIHPLVCAYISITIAFAYYFTIILLPL